MFKSPLGVQQVAQAVIDLSRIHYTGVVHVAGQRLSVYEFHRQAMSALQVDTTKLKTDIMPIASGFLRDTSLDTTLWQKLTNSKPKTIEETLLSHLKSERS